jgi:hypothetical protein
VQHRSDIAPQDTTVQAHARKLLRVDAARPKSLAEFSAFDLSLDDAARASLAAVRDAVSFGDALVERVRCLWRLVRIEPNPETVERLLGRVALIAQQFEREGRIADCASALDQHVSIAAALREQRPDVATAIDRAHAAFCTTERIARIVARAEHSDDGIADASVMIEALGPAAAVPLLSLSKGPRARIVADLILAHAGLLAPALAEALDGLAAPQRRIAARTFGIAGAGYELPLSRLLKSDDEHTVHEALRSLARIGSARAASLVAAEIGKPGSLGAAAEQALWQFPRAEAQRQILNLLSAREFVLRQPAVAERLLDKAPRSKVKATLGSLEGLRFRFWSPSVARLGRKAHALLAPR